MYKSNHMVAILKQIFHWVHLQRSYNIHKCDIFVFLAYVMLKHIFLMQIHIFSFPHQFIQFLSSQDCTLMCQLVANMRQTTVSRGSICFASRCGAFSLWLLTLMLWACCSPAHYSRKVFKIFYK